MKFLTARVIGGQVSSPPGTANEGVVVTLLVPDNDADGFELAPSEKASLLEFIAQANRGDIVDG